MKLWVIDPNVVVSAFLSSAGPPAHLLRAVSDRQIKLAYDARILEEYREVLNRPSLRIAPSVMAMFLASMRGQKLVLATRHLCTGPDPADLKFIEVALATRQKTLVTGNIKDFPRSIRHGVRIITPAQAVVEF